MGRRPSVCSYSWIDNPSNAPRTRNRYNMKDGTSLIVLLTLADNLRVFNILPEGHLALWCPVWRRGRSTGWSSPHSKEHSRTVLELSFTHHVDSLLTAAISTQQGPDTRKREIPSSRSAQPQTLWIVRYTLPHDLSCTLLAVAKVWYLSGGLSYHIFLILCLACHHARSTFAGLMKMYTDIYGIA